MICGTRYTENYVNDQLMRYRLDGEFFYYAKYISRDIFHANSFSIVVKANRVLSEKNPDASSS